MIRETNQVQNSTYYMIHFVLKVQNSQINRYRKGFPRDTNGKEPDCQHRRQEMQVQSLGQEDPLEESMAIHSSILAWRIPLTEEPGRLQSIESQRVVYD